MRNLVLLGECHREVAGDRRAHSDDDDHGGGVSRHLDDVLVDMAPIPFASNQSETTLVILTKNGFLISSTTEEKSGQTLPWTVCDLNQVCQSPAAQWFNLTYVDPHMVALSKSGAIVTVNPWTGQAELVGEFDHGLEAGAWSPDRGLLLLVTFAEADEEEEDIDDDNNNNIVARGRKSVLLTMNAQWEVISEINFESHIPSSHMTATEELLSHTPGSVSIVWRTDGSLCAVSSVDVVDQTRKIRIYQRDSLKVHALGRTEDGSGKLVPNLVGSAGLAWANSGCSHLLTAVQRKGTSSQQVVFFEPNGLRHREFMVRDGSASDVLGLTWNASSDLLAVWLRDMNDVRIDKVQLWHRSNYHWYLKQEFRYAPGQQVTCCMFHDEFAHVLYIGLAPGLQWREYEVRWDTSTVHTTMDSCTSVVIDGNTLNFTPFEKAIVPPPMYAASVKLDLPIRQVFFPNGKFITVSTVAQLSNGNLILLGGDGNQSDLVPGFTAPKVVAVAALSVPNDIDPSLIRSLVVVAEESAVVLQLAAVYPAASNQSNDRLIEIRVSLADDGQASAKIVGMHPLEGRVLRMISWSDGAPGALLQLRDGQLLEYEVSADDPGTVLPSPAESLLEPCPWMAALNDAMQFSDSGQIQKERLVVGMTHRSRLYCHDRLLCDAVSSFVLSPTHRFLSYATSAARCHLRFLPITDLLAFDPLMGLDENQLLEGFDARPIERGARLVALGASQPIAVLQMPRGNLEGLYPRALVLPFAISSIVREAYDEAFNLMRRQKVDLNLIVDVDPRRFLTEGVSRLLEQVTQIDHLNLFISCLHNWDTTKSKYSVSAWLPRLNQDEDDADGFDFAVKVNLVCSKLRSIMLRAEADGHTQGGRPVGDGHFLLPVLSTFAKEDPPKLKEALTLIKENAISKHPATSRKPPLFSERAQSSIQYLAFLANYDLLFETALGIYDFELARSIARNSQMDPKVYLPLIKRFQSLPECYARFQVDLRLKRYETALSNLFESAEQMENLEETSTAESPLVVDNSFETCLSFIDEHGLHSQGLRLFKKYPEKQRQVMLSLGNHLLQQQQSDTALAVFLAAKPPDYDGAKRAARMNGDWRFFFSLPVDLSDINDINSAADRRRLVAHEIAEELAERASGSQTRRQELANAARIFLDYSNDVGAAVDMFMNAEMWDEGFRVARLHSREDLAKKCVDAAIAYSHFLVADFEERLESFLTSHKRYGEVLKIRKQARGEEHYGESGEVAEETGSFFSAASNASIDSLRSNTSSASMGSVTSLSSVISVKSSSTFAFKGEHANRHKSKFSKNASEKKKSTKKKPKKGKIRPGSEEDLRSVVDTLKASFVESDYCALVASTISFICHVENMIDLAGDVYRTYCVMKNTVNDAQLARIESARQERIVEERRARKDGTAYETIVLPIETEVDALSCPDLPESLHRLFEYIS